MQKRKPRKSKKVNNTVKASTKDITIGQLALKIMENMSDLRRQSEAVGNLFSAVDRIASDINSANNKIVSHLHTLEAKVLELEKLVLGKLPNMSDTGNIEQ